MFDFKESVYNYYKRIDNTNGNLNKELYLKDPFKQIKISLLKL